MKNTKNYLYHRLGEIETFTNAVNVFSCKVVHRPYILLFEIDIIILSTETRKPAALYAAGFAI